MEQDQRLEELHQRAAESYLQGKFEVALSEWRKLLAVAPEDKRAKEGARLCELLLEQKAQAEATPVSATAAVAAASSAPQAPPIAVAAPPETEPAAAEADWDLGFDMEDVPDSEGDAPATGVGVELADLSEIDAALAGPEAEPAPVLTGAADEELRKRVSELLLEARTVYEAGDRETASSILTRIFILDEENAEALALQQQMERPDAAAPADEAPVAEDVGFDFDLSEADEPAPIAAASADGEAELDAPLDGVDMDFGALDGPDESDLADSLELDLESSESGDTPSSAEMCDPSMVDTGGSEEDAAVPLASAPAEAEAPVAESEAEVDDGEAPEAAPETAGPVAAQAPLAASAGRSRFSLPSRKVLMLVAALVILTAGAYGGFVWWTAPGDTSELDAALEAARRTPKAQKQAAAETTEPAPEEGQQGGLDIAVEDPQVSVVGMLTSARQSMAEGSYSAAIISFNEVLQLDPDNGEATDGLAEAGRLYQEQRAYEEKITSAVDFFRKGDHRSALQIFYRLSGSDADPRIERYKANGWYNMAVQALRRSDCGEARSHLDEFDSLRPGDPDAAQLANLAILCREIDRPRSYYNDIESLPLRDIDFE